MGRRKQEAQEGQEAENEPSRAAGVLVAVTLAGAVVGAAFAVDEAAGVLLVTVAGGVALHRSASRMSDSSATPPPPLSGDVFAAHSDEIERIQQGPGEGMTILYPRRVEGEVNDR
ncbi:hypothetical protein [Streptomyces sediminimaris]|uniref:hypothetical protein n=1 Tax=Streptomyces sediminimaris TaxID=3383721 RepID=UPI00399AB35C